MKREKQIAELVERLRSNDRAAQRMVFDMFKDGMFAICKRYAKSSSEAEDALTEGFLKVFQCIGTFSGKGSFAAWMRKIFVNNCVTIYRSELKYNSVYKTSDVPEKTPEIESPERFSVEDLYDALSCLSDKERVIFNLAAVDGLKYSEIEAELGIKVDVLKTILYRAKQKLKIRLAEIETMKGVSE